MKTRRLLLRLCALLIAFSCNASFAESAPAPGYTFRDCPSCPAMTVIPTGRFVLDATASAQAVEIGRSFALGKYEVTFEEWDACVADGGCGGYRPSDEGWGREDRPVMNVSWQDASQYAQWLSQKTGRHYRLPTEAEWEYAARAGLSPHHLKGELPDAPDCDNCVGQWANLQTAPVGRLEPNPFGLFDTHGNVWEWVSDCADCNCESRILRGAALGNGKAVSRASRRLRNSGSDRNGHGGFRVALSLDKDAATGKDDPATAQPPELPRTVGSLIAVACGQAGKNEPECKPVKEVYHIKTMDEPIVIEGAFFDTDSAVLKPEGREKLDMVVQFAEKYRDANLDVTGHTDSSGSEAWNRELSAARADSVKEYLVGNGVDPDRISTKGVASTQPIDTNETPEGKARNRRVEIRATVRVENRVRVEQPAASLPRNGAVFPPYSPHHFSAIATRITHAQKTNIKQMQAFGPARRRMSLQAIPQGSEPALPENAAL
jgi:outer membrane protein OmpA-like peptidoglycan-associated protein